MKSSREASYTFGDNYESKRFGQKKMCRKCKIIKRKGVVRVICSDPRHKQRQG